MDLLQIDIITKIIGITSKSKGNNYIITLTQPVTISANMDVIVTLIPPNIINDFFFNP